MKLMLLFTSVCLGSVVGFAENRGNPGRDAVDFLAGPAPTQSLNLSTPASADRNALPIAPDDSQDEVDAREVTQQMHPGPFAPVPPPGESSTPAQPSQPAE